MQQGNYEYRSSFAKQYVAEGKAEGEARGKAEGEAKGLLLALEIKGFTVPEALRAHIMGCTDLARLDTWYARVKSATRLADIFDAALLNA